MKAVVLFALAILLTVSPGLMAEDSEVEAKAVKKAAMDYIEGWFEASVERMDRALHPKLTKRMVMFDAQSGKEEFRDLTKEQMVEYTKNGGGAGVPEEKRAISCNVLDIYRDIATVRVESVHYIDYLHLAKTEGGWKIVNVLWLPNVKERETVEIDSGLYQDYAGEYELQPGFIIAVTTDQDRIFVQATDQPKLEIYPESETKFFLKVTDAQLTFVRDEQGKVTQVILHQGGQELPAKKIK